MTPMLRPRTRAFSNWVCPCLASVTDCSSWCTRLGGKVRAAGKREYGHADVEIKNGSRFFKGLPQKLSVWMSHGDEAVELPSGFNLVASSPSAVAAIEAPERKMWAVQFHPEVRHTQSGTDILRNFALEICGAKPTWTAQHFIDATVASVRQTVGDGRAICALPAAWIPPWPPLWSTAPCATEKAGRA